VGLGPELLDLLRALKRQTPRSLDEVHQRVGGAKSSVHNRLKRLVELGHATHIPRVGFKLTDSGKAARAVGAPRNEARPRLPLPPEVRRLPEVHQAVIELALCAAAGRFHGVFDDALVSLLLYGPGLKLKTLVMRIVCALAGGDPQRHVLRLFKESAASATLRRDNKGVARIRDVASAPVVGLDEYARASDDVRRACLIYVFGEAHFPEADGTTLKVLATPVIALNPPEGADPKDVSLETLTGFDQAMRRRMILADLSAVEIPAALQSKAGKQIFEAVKKAGPHSLPRPTFRDHVPDELVQQALRTIFDTPDRLKEADVLMIAQLVPGATGYELDKEAATRNVLWNVATCYETRGWLRPEWRTSLAALLGAPDDQGPPERPDLKEVYAQARRLGLTWDEVMGRLSLPERLAECGVELKKSVELHTFLHERGLTDTKALDAALEQGLEARKLGLRPGDTTKIGRVLARDLGPEVSLEAALRGLLQALDGYDSVEAATAGAQARHEQTLAKHARELQEVRTNVLSQRQLLSDYERMLDGLRSAVAEARMKPDAGPIVKELEDLMGNAFMTRLQAHMEWLRKQDDGR
jgi:hypothetical protein